MSVEGSTITSRIKNLLRSPSIKLRRSKPGNKREDIGSKVSTVWFGQHALTLLPEVPSVLRILLWETWCNCRVMQRNQYVIVVCLLIGISTMLEILAKAQVALLKRTLFACVSSLYQKAFGISHTVACGAVTDDRRNVILPLPPCYQQLTIHKRPVLLCKQLFLAPQSRVL